MDTCTKFRVCTSNAIKIQEDLLLIFMVLKFTIQGHSLYHFLNTKLIMTGRMEGLLFPHFIKQLFTSVVIYLH